MFFDVTVAAPPPKGLFLCLKLLSQGKKVCYIETAAEQGPQSGALFLDSALEEEKAFLLRLYFLEKQRGGFSIVSEQGVWGLQERGIPPAPAIRKARKGDLSGSFQDSWLSFFALNYKSRLFVRNNAVLGGRPLSLFEDCFLLKPSLEKKRRFLAENPGLSWVHGSSCGLKIKDGQIFLKGALHKSQSVFLLQEPSFEDLEDLRPAFQWVSMVLDCNLPAEYEEALPPHFVLIDRLRAPWALENLLSVFKERRGRRRVWMRRPFSLDRRLADSLPERAAALMHRLFKTPIRFVEHGPPGFAVYGGESLGSLKKQRPLFTSFPEDLGLHIQAEKELFEKHRPAP